jgi:hypothetical protein
VTAVQISERAPTLADRRAEAAAQLVAPLTTERAARDSGQVRAMRYEDIPAVAALRQQVFRRTERASPRELASYLDQIFFQSPAGDHPARDSLVYEDGAGRLAGFLGVIPRQMHFGTRTLQVRVGTQLMVAPEAPGLVGRRLTRALCDGPQDLILSDTANDAARRLWESIGGHVAVSHSFSWYRALQPLRLRARGAATSIGTRVASLAARPLISLADAILTMRAGVRPVPEASDRVSDLVIERDLSALTSVLAHWQLRPLYSATSLQWTLEQVERKRGCGPLRARIIRDAAERGVGWFIYCGARGDLAQVVQIGARKHETSRVLAHLFADGHARGVVGMTGRLDPAAAPALTAAGAWFTHEGPWVLAHARDRTILSAFETGRAFVSRLDGEWWLGF